LTQKLKDKLLASKKATQKSDMDRFDPKKLNHMEIKYSIRS